MDTKSNSNTRRGDNSKSNKARTEILVHNMSSHPVLHFYQVSSKDSEGHSCYRAGMNSNSIAGGGDNSTRIPRKASSHLLGQKSQEPQSERGYYISLFHS